MYYMYVYMYIYIYIGIIYIYIYTYIIQDLMFKEQNPPTCMRLPRKFDPKDQ